MNTTQIHWYHDGLVHRVRLSPQGPRSVSDEKVVWERQNGPKWERFVPNPVDESFLSAAFTLDDETWEGFIAQLPPAWEDFLAQFGLERLESLAVLSQCPDLLPHLDAVPALTVFLANHMALRGADEPRWTEINAVYERGNIYAVLEWLGMPASPQTLALLADERDPELPRRDLEHTRRALWEVVTGHPLAA